ncbi:uncharacterized protein Z519_02189 [Cladophialophora bantiana CBS 173.52]|uniref:Uncharacterized protein n=1 Tax=Cladophialophora bantiana (strain ATCC 10958 / CBS 173.52 / CDC B-1940 / NIH 8579) TaxID=1442370 RepID=A0A0D2HTM2_CLAB1|nr:uncharacterized protein Z519_02189 [Cladophialophora bantiana CBS 173.52]KIW96798.1 hypothetical protein Z519_02189 [Cladophialophora bantiana CBS 173.52]
MPRIGHSPQRLLGLGLGRPLKGNSRNSSHFFQARMVATYSDMQGKIALVTGIGQAHQSKDPNIWGNGAATARLLARNGVKIVGCDLDIKGAETAKSRILSENPGASVDVFATDVTQSTQVKDLVAAAVEKYGRIDYLINNVGLSRPGGPVELTEEAFEQQLKVNLTSAFLCCKQVLPVMVKQQSGSIIATSSIAGLGYMGKAHIGYATTKAALLNFAKCVAVQYAPWGIRINAVIPGLIATPLVERLADEYHEGNYEGLMKQRGGGVPLGRQGTADEVANATLFLLSDAASYITGTSRTVDGGTTAVVCNYG